MSIAQGYSGGGNNIGRWRKRKQLLRKDKRRMSGSWETKAKSVGTKQRAVMGGEGEMLGGKWGTSFYGWKVRIRGWSRI